MLNEVPAAAKYELGPSAVQCGPQAPTGLLKKGGLVHLGIDVKELGQDGARSATPPSILFLVEQLTAVPRTEMIMVVLVALSLRMCKFCQLSQVRKPTHSASWNAVASRKN